MTNKPFGVEELNIVGSAGTALVESVADLHIRVGGGCTVGIGTSTLNIQDGTADANNDSVLNAGIVTANSYYGTFKGTIDSSVAIATDRILQGNTLAQVVDTGTDGHFLVKTEGTERLRIIGIGSVGIGTTIPRYDLDITKISTSPDTSLRLYNDETGATRDTVMRFEIAGTESGNYIYFGDGDDTNAAQIVYSHSVDAMRFFTGNTEGNSPDPATGGDNTFERLRITSLGDVGIGTDNPIGVNAVSAGNTAVLAVGVLTARELYGTFKGTIDPGSSTVSISTNIEDVFSVSSNTISADDPGGDRIIFWDHSEAELTHLSLGTGLEIDGTSLKTNSDAGNTYTLEAVDSNPNTTLRLSDGSTNDDVLITAGTNVSFADTTASGFTINVASGAGITFSAIDVKQYTDVPSSRTERSCTNPIVVHVESDTATIGIGSTSNAYGNKFLQEDDPTTPEGGSWTVCDGDIWYDTSTLGSGGDVSGSNRQVQFNDGGVLAGAANLLFYKSTTQPQLILRPSDTSVSSNGGEMIVENGDNTNHAVLHSDGGIELYRSDSTTTYGGPYIDFKYQGSKDMDARIQMEHTDAYSGISNDEFSSLMFYTGGGNLPGGSDPGLVTKKFTIGRYGQIGLCTVTETNNVGYGTTGNVLISDGPSDPAYWSHTPKQGEWWHSTKRSVPLIYSDGVMEVGRFIDFHHSAGSNYDWDGRIELETAGTGSGSGSQPATGGAFLAYNSISNVSDRRIKENLKVITSALDKVGVLTGYTFNYNNIGIDPNNSPRRAGIIAQDVEKVLPEVIVQGQEGIKGVTDSGVTALLVEAIKELKAENEDLKARIVNLESQSK